MDLKQTIYNIIYHKYDRYYFDDTKTSLVSGYKDLFDRGRDFDILINKNISSACEYKKIFGINTKKTCSFERILEKLVLCELKENAYDFHVNYRGLLEALKKVDITKKTEDVCRRFLYVFNTRGMYRAACVLRERYALFLLRNGTISQKFSVYIETGKYKEAKQLINSSPYFKLIKMLGMHEYETYSNCIGILNDADDHKNKNDILFKNYIQGKRVVIIGPSNNEDDMEITDKDVIIQYAYMGKKLEKNKNIKLDLSYYNGRYGTKLAQSEDVHFLDELFMMVFKYEEDNSFRQKKYKQNKARRARWSHRIMYFGSPNMLQITLTDLLLMGAKNIYVTDNNLYLNNKYSKNYISNATIAGMDDYTKRSQFAQHDLIGNFQYLKTLYEKKYFKCDAVLDRIINLSSMEYAHEMEIQNGCLRGKE